MRPYLKYFWIILVFFIFSGTGFAQDKMWEKDFIIALQKGKLEKIKSSGGLGYTRPENIILDDAIKKAIEDWQSK